MSYLSLVALCLAAALAVSAYPHDDPTPVVQDPPKYTMEAECGRVGGMCMPAEECPRGQLAEPRGLCPQQQNMGVECCHGLSIKERRCSARGGVCRAAKGKCPRQLLLEADDCPEGYTCCALV
uniref:Venom carboxypeptidase inhibitor-like protein n=1 Tax=Lethocerus distinctifemur TaxID=280095 RepID=A0A2K8JVU2_9HEMI|nr:venom carboxypeptidase inhibitor-like protein [Lethocerus distinctifemur]